MTKKEHFIYRCITEVLGRKKRKNITQTCRIISYLYEHAHIFNGVIADIAPSYLRQNQPIRCNFDDLKIICLKAYISCEANNIDNGWITYAISPLTKDSILAKLKSHINNLN